MALNQTHFRVRTDATAAQGGTPVWAAAQDANAVVPANTPLRIRFSVYFGGPGTLPPTSWQLYYKKNSGAYALVPTTLGEVYATDATAGASVNGQSITTRLLTSSNTFASGGLYVTNGNSIPNAAGFPVANTEMEFEFGLEFGANVGGNSYSFRVYETNGPVDIYGNTPTFTFSLAGTLAVTESDDTLAGAGNVPRAAVLAVTEADDGLIGTAGVRVAGVLSAAEAGDTLIGNAYLPVSAVLSALEGNDVLVGSGAVIPLGGATAVLNSVEAGDIVGGLGSVTGFIGSANIIENGDILVGSGYLPHLIPFNEWVPVPPPVDVWVEVTFNG